MNKVITLTKKEMDDLVMKAFHFGMEEQASVATPKTTKEVLAIIYNK